MMLLILSAIVIGNASYEAGNISGGILGLETIVGEIRVDLGNYSLNFLSLILFILNISLIAFVSPENLL